MKKPPLNESPEAVRLRKAAAAWGRAIDQEPLDDEDRESQRLNRDLLRAACEYHHAVQADGGGPLREIASIIEAVDERALAVDGPVPSTMEMMTQAEMSRIYKICTGSRRRRR